MSAQDKFKEMMDRVPTDVVAVDCATSGTRAVRMKKSASGYLLAGAEAYDAVPLKSALEISETTAAFTLKELPLTPKMRARFSALSAPGGQSVLKLLRLPEKFDLDDPAQVLGRLGFDKPEGYRVATKVVQAATARTEALVLAAAMPERLAGALLHLMPKAGPLAPRSIGISELGVLNAFHNDPRRGKDGTAHGLLHFDHDFSVLALFNQDRLSQLRTFPFGLEALLQKIMGALNVDAATAAGVLTDGAFDVSHMVGEQTREVESQYVVCRDFMERSENCNLKKLYVSGPEVLTGPYLKGAAASEARERWNVLDAYPERAGGCMSERLATEGWPLTAAIGACLGVLEPA